MRIRPTIITGSAAMCAMVGLWLMVSSNDPETSGSLVRTIIPIAAALAGWAILATVLLWFRLHLAQAVWSAGLLVVDGIAVLSLWHNGFRDLRVLIAITIVVVTASIWSAFTLRTRV